MDMKFMDEYYECVRADYMCELVEQHSDKWESSEKSLKEAWNALIEGLGLTHLFAKDSKLSAEEIRILKLFLELDSAAGAMELVLHKGAYMVGAEDRDRMLH